MKQHYKIYENNRLYLAETEDYKNVYGLLLKSDFPNVPQDVYVGIEVLKETKILGFYDKKEGHLVGAILFFNKNYLDMAMDTSIHKRWATKGLCKACLTWAFNVCEEDYLNMVLYKDTSRMIRFLGGELSEYDAFNKPVYVLRKTEINDRLSLNTN